MLKCNMSNLFWGENLSLSKMSDHVSSTRDQSFWLGFYFHTTVGFQTFLGVVFCDFFVKFFRLFAV